MCSYGSDGWPASCLPIHVAEVLGQRLEAMSEWLLLAGEEVGRVWPWQRQRLPERPLALPFIRALIQRDLELLCNMQQEAEPEFGAE